jgi:glycosyltransferase involved in cell wall biosynthesis
LRLVAISDAQRRGRPHLPWIGTVHNSVQVDKFPYRVDKSGPAMWLARFNPDKGPDLAILACREAGVPLVLAGKCTEPAERAYLDHVVRPLAGPGVEIVLNADRALTLRLLASARCLLLPLRWPEPFGMVMIEAMACGTPVVALNWGAVPEVVAHGETGLICERPTELPDALHRVTALSPAACRSRVRRSFSAEVMARRYEHVYRATVAAAVTPRQAGAADRLRAEEIVAEPSTTSPW